MGEKIRIRIREPDHISESLKTIFWVKILKFFDAVGWKKFGSGMEKFGSGMEKNRIRDGKNSDPG